MCARSADMTADTTDRQLVELVRGGAQIFNGGSRRLKASSVEQIGLHLFMELFVFSSNIY